jgi:hypothetical protein
MKTKFACLLFLASMALGCQPDFESFDESSNGSPTAFEGKWLWLKTDGSGVAGPYHADSTTVGYSMIYEFGFTDLQVYRDNIKAELYSYTYTVSDKPEEQRLTLKSKSHGGEETLLWELTMIDNIYYLFLRNAEPCCDDTFEQQFRLVSRPN